MTDSTPSGRQYSRRGLLRAGMYGGALFAASALVEGSATSPAGAAPRLRGPLVQTRPFNQGWRFCGEYVSGGADPGFADGGFAEVTLPHSVVPLSWRQWDPSSWEKVWLYRRHLTGPMPPRSRIFLDFEGALVNATVACNGATLNQHVGGYLPWNVELTDHLTDGDNVIAVILDSRWLQVPPDGGSPGASYLDFLEPGGIYRDVALRLVPEIFISDVWAKPLNVLNPDRTVEVRVTLDAAATGNGHVAVELRGHSGHLAHATTPVHITATGQNTVSLTLSDIGAVSLWEPDSPTLYDVVTTLTMDDGTTHAYTTRIGFREATFTTEGFFLNGRKVKLFGLNRHQIYPYVGMAMPARVQRRDAQILKNDFNCNMVRCSHYPQSRHFLDACDELGLMVWQEPPGWWYVGDQAWQDLLAQNVSDMIIRDRNRPSVIVWGIKANESPNYPELYARTRQIAGELDGTRQTSGSMATQSTDGWAADVFSYDDYHRDSKGNATLSPPLTTIPYLVSEAVGALDGAPYYRWIDTQDVLATQAITHATVHDIARSDDHYCGLLGWCGFDYDSQNGHIYDDVKWPGVADTFRVPKFGAAFYQSQVDPHVRPVLEPAFFWDFGSGSPAAGPGKQAVIGTNCDRLEIYIDGRHTGTALPDAERFPHLIHPLVFADLSVHDTSSFPKLRIDGYVGHRQVISRSWTSDPAHDRLSLVADDSAIDADGSDATRVVFRAVDAHGNQRPYVTGKVSLSLSGPGVLVGDNPFAFDDFGGVGAVWIRSVSSRTGVVRLTARHPQLGSASVTVAAV